jgi:hypothetical protein
MLHIAKTTTLWISFPLLLTASMFSPFAGSYELPLNAVVCVGAIVAVQRAAWIKSYYWAGASTAIAMVYSPLPLVAKIFLLLGLACGVSSAATIAAFKRQSLPAA